MNNLNIKKKVNKNIKHQNIGGKEILIEMEVSKEEVFTNAILGNWACYNFIQRREDFNYNFPHKIYYGKVNNLDYIVAEDKLEEV